MTAVTLVLADDHQVVRSGLRRLLEAELGADILGEASNGEAALDLAESLRPHVLVVDMMMPILTGLEVCRRLAQRAPDTRAIVLSMHADEGYVREALRAGAYGYVLKEAHASEFVQAVRDAAAGRRYLSSALTERMIDSYLQNTLGSTEDAYDLLTKRERNVLYLAALGHTAPEIASQLSLSARTIETYRTSVLRKLELRNQTDLVRYAIKRGIIGLDV